MTILIAGALIALIWTVSAQLAFAAAVVITTALIIHQLVREPQRAPVATVTRLPTEYEQAQTHRRWGWAIGFGLTTHGPFPFITVYRRRRP